ncbi:MAG TPA: hypothetical protein VN428_11985 [Bryobacteraceae bacterium]|nr:hypothetical protein [Bryobacteraceae bacterium]
MPVQPTRRAFAATLAGTAAATAFGTETLWAAGPLQVKAQRWLSKEWQTFETRTLDDLPLTGKVPAFGKFGGRKDRKFRATGFFRVEKVGKRWWYVDPEGRPCIQPAITSVGPGGSERALTAMKEKYGTEERWAAEATRFLRGLSFNALGAWCKTDLLRKAPNQLPYHTTMGMMSDFGKAKKLTVRQPGHTGFINSCMPVFHPEFASFCDQTAQKLAETKDDPHLVGHFSDNELPSPPDWIVRYLSLDATDPRVASDRKAAEDWLKKRKGALVSASEITDEDRDAFREYVYDEYLRVTTGAIRKHDPNHVCLGPRLWGPSMDSPGILRACGRHLEAIGINVYFHWATSQKLIDLWDRESGKPFIVTEFYAKGMDSGLSNTTGAGWTVATQEDRARFYQHFTLGLIECRNCVGWQWLTYMDNDPQNKGAELSNLDSNKGIVNVRHEPWVPLVNGMKALNRRVYELADRFDRV